MNQMKYKEKIQETYRVLYRKYRKVQNGGEANRALYSRKRTAPAGRAPDQTFGRNFPVDATNRCLHGVKFGVLFVRYVE